ncbi:MAG: hypothetical protein ACI8RD_006588 [Bacillariaceae sp.]|jgi:hypothetical protein
MKEKQKNEKGRRKIQIPITRSIVSGINAKQANFFSLFLLAVASNIYA